MNENKIEKEGIIFLAQVKTPLNHYTNYHKNCFFMYMTSCGVVAMAQGNEDRRLSNGFWHVNICAKVLDDKPQTGRYNIPCLLDNVYNPSSRCLRPGRQPTRRKAAVISRNIIR